MDGFNQSAVSGLLRFITAGSVDDGKSTLIGRLLFDSKTLHEDQLSAIEASSRKRGMQSVDLSLLTDGLSAEREQGITIDVAYRYFSTPSRKFIVGDTPGHIQYTRNMVTAASTADAAVILVDAESGVKTQTRRHLYLAHWVGVSRVVFAVNKMDTIGHDQTAFELIRDSLIDLAKGIGYEAVDVIPVSALHGDNVVKRGENMPWYLGSTLLEYLEQVPGAHDSSNQIFRFSVQRVLRVNRDNVQRYSDFENMDCRGYQGLILSGTVQVGDRITVSQNGSQATVERILLSNKEFGQSAISGESVTIFLEHDIDVSRGYIFSKFDQPMSVARDLDAALCWFDEAPFDGSKTYSMKHGSDSVRVKVKEIQYRVDVDSLEKLDAEHRMVMNDIARIQLRSQRDIAFDKFTVNRQTGVFILIDEINNHTVAAGTIQ
jgi:sulfate adenylyltransferase subunit 1